MSSKLFRIKILQPTFDQLYKEYGELFSGSTNESKLLKELKGLQREMNDAYKGGRNNGQAMIDVFTRALPLVKKIDTTIHHDLSENLKYFSHFYTINTMYIGNTFIPYLKACINLVNQAVTNLETEENFFDEKEIGLEQEIDSRDSEFDVFISHASEDKDSFVEPLAQALKKEGISVWYDNFQLKWGDKLRESIDKGLRNSKYGVVVLSRSFLTGKKWTEHELDGLFAREDLDRKIILPIWHDISREDILKYSPSLADRLAKRSGEDEITSIVQELKDLLGK